MGYRVWNIILDAIYDKTNINIIGNLLLQEITGKLAE
jgi:hypothetical protein